MNKKERPPEIEDERDTFFFRQKQQQQQEQPKKKKVKQPKTVPVSEVLHVKPKRHRGFNTVPEEKTEKKHEVRKDDQEKGTEGTPTEQRREPKGTEGTGEKGRGENKPQGREEGWGDRSQQGRDRKQGGERRTPGRRNRIDMEQFPSLSENIAPAQPPKPWFPPTQV